MDQYITAIALTGKKENIVKMLNAVISNVGLEEAIVEVDGLETINRKLTDDDGDGVVIGIPDLLSAEYLKDEVLMQKKAEFEKDSEEGDLYNVSTESAIEFVRVEDSGDDYIAKFSLYEYEEYCYADYVDWSDIARLYGCRAFIDTNYHRNGRFLRFQQAAIHEPEADGVKTTVLESGETEEEYDRFFEQLAQLCPERYLPMQKQYLKEKADKQEYQHLTEKHGVAIHHGLWTRFASWEGENSVETLRKVFEANVNEAARGRENITQDEFATVLRLRAEKWKGLNDWFAKCYASLLAELPKIWEQDVQQDTFAEYEKKKDSKSSDEDDDEDLPF